MPARFSLILLLIIAPLTSHGEAQRWVTDGCQSVITSPEVSFNCGVIATSPIEWCSAIGGGGYTLYGVELQAPPFDQYVKCKFSKDTGTGGVWQYGRRDMTGPAKECPMGTIRTPFGDCARPIMRKNRCDVGNPIEINSGSKMHRETDATLFISGADIKLTRTYTSEKVNTQTGSNLVAPSWFFTFNDRVSYTKIQYAMPLTNTRHRIAWTRGDGVIVIFSGDDANNLQSSDSFASYIAPILPGTTNSGWIIRDRDQNEYSFNSAGRLTSYQKAGLYKIDFTHSPMNDLTFAYIGSQLIFTFERDVNKNYLIKKLIFPDGKVFQYNYDSLLNLTKETLPDGQFKTYHYENVSFPRALTGITNERNVRYATWVYDASGRAVSSAHAGNRDSETLDYSYYDDLTDPRLIGTNPLGRRTIYHFSIINNQRLITRIDGEQSANCAATFMGHTYTNTGELDTTTDWNGNITKYETDSKGREIKKTEALGTNQEKITETCWHNALDQKLRILDPDKITLFAYWPNGKLKSRTIMARPMGSAVTCTSSL